MYWTTKELDILKEYFPIGGQYLCKMYLPHRSEEAIRTKSVNDLGLVYEGNGLRKWTIDEINFLKEHYPTKGMKYCSEYLGKSVNSISQKLRKLKIHKSKYFWVTRDGQQITKYRNFDNLYDLENPKILYLLGLLWADGYVNDTVTLDMVSTDLNEIITKLDLFNLLPGISVLYDQAPRSKRINCKDTTRIHFGNKQIITYLKSNNYLPYRPEEPIITQLIKEELRHHWFRGFIDGDGCIYFKKPRARIMVSGFYKSTYNYILDMASYSNTKVSIYCKFKTEKVGNSLQCIFSGLENVSNLINYLYKDWNNIGLDRKYNKALQILDYSDFKRAKKVRGIRV